MPKPTSRRIDEPDLPNGGAYAILRFQDADGAPVEESQAVRIEVFEYDAQDKPIAGTFIDVNGEDDDYSTGLEDSVE